MSRRFRLCLCFYLDLLSTGLELLTATVFAKKLKKLATEAGVDVTLGLVYRMFQYAAEDVVRVRKAGKLERL